MTESTLPASALRRADLSEQRLKRRYAAERRFRLYGASAIAAALLILALLVGTIVANGYTAFALTYVSVPVHLDAQAIDPEGTRDHDVLFRADYQTLVKESLREMFPDVTGRREKIKLYGLVSNAAGYDVLGPLIVAFIKGKGW